VIKRSDSNSFTVILSGTFMNALKLHAFLFSIEMTGFQLWKFSDQQ